MTVVSLTTVAQAAYLVAAVLFILSLAGLALFIVAIRKVRSMGSS